MVIQYLRARPLCGHLVKGQICRRRHPSDATAPCAILAPQSYSHQWRLTYLTRNCALSSAPKRSGVTQSRRYQRPAADPVSRVMSSGQSEEKGSATQWNSGELAALGSAEPPSVGGPRSATSDVVRGRSTSNGAERPSTLGCDRRVNTWIGNVTTKGADRAYLVLSLSASSIQPCLALTQSTLGRHHPFRTPHHPPHPSVFVLLLFLPPTRH